MRNHRWCGYHLKSITTHSFTSVKKQNVLLFFPIVKLSSKVATQLYLSHFLCIIAYYIYFVFSSEHFNFIQISKIKTRTYTFNARAFFLEAPLRIGLRIKVLQTSALPLGYGAMNYLYFIICVTFLNITIKNSNIIILYIP